MEKLSSGLGNTQIQNSKLNKVKNFEKSSEEKTKQAELKKVSEDVKVELSDRAKELKKELIKTEEIKKITDKKLKGIAQPGIYFVSGFDWFGAGSIKGNYDGIRDMSEAVKGSKHFSWDQQEEIIEDIKKRKEDQPIILVGHSFGGDGVMEIAEELNSLEHGFRKIDLLVTLDSVGYDNDKVPQNVKKNLNYLAQGPYDFLNDGPNIALNYERTKVENFLRPEKHAELDDNTEIQMTVLDEIKGLLSKDSTLKQA